MKRTLVIASDHAGFEMKRSLIKHLEQKGYEVTDLGTDSPEPVNYPDFGHPLAEAVESGKYRFGISICGSGNGINMVTNKHQGIRGALCWSEEISAVARKHNDANICSLPARFIDLPTAIKIVDVFLTTDYEGGRHDIRIRHIPIQT
jgi:ribose 5-phosphate isomerase B